MRSILNTREEALLPFYGLLQYHLGWVEQDFQTKPATSGKRLRPAICLLVCESAGGEVGKAVPAAAAVELVHNFSLIHDDVEDRSPERRGRETLWKLWGDPLAINAGDALMALAHLAVQRLTERGVAKSLVAEALAILDKACLSLSQGQYLDLIYQDSLEVTVEMYLEMAAKKTASLLEAAAHLGALLATQDQKVIASYRRFAQALGMGFQITDDLLGIWGDREKTGKEVGEDILARKKTLPVVYALQEEKRQSKNSLARIYHKPKLGKEDMVQITALLQESGAAEYCQKTAQALLQEAWQVLASLGWENSAKDKLRKLAAFLVERSH